jgi:hypothetical protein
MAESLRGFSGKRKGGKDDEEAIGASGHGASG